MTVSAITRYRRALAGVTAVADAVPAGSWRAPSPCQRWSARDVLGHLIDGQRQIAALLGGDSPPRPATEPGRLAGPDPAAAWRRASSEMDTLLDTVLDPLLDGQQPDVTVSTPLGTRDVAGLLAMAVIEPLVHAWDLAVSTGRQVHLDAEAVTTTLAGIRALDADLATSGMYAPARPPRPGAGPTDELLAATGRDPDLWRPA